MVPPDGKGRRDRSRRARRATEDATEAPRRIDLQAPAVWALGYAKSAPAFGQAAGNARCYIYIYIYI